MPTSTTGTSPSSTSNYVSCPADDVCLNGGRCFLASPSSSPFSVQDEDAFPEVDLVLAEAATSWFEAYQDCTESKRGSLVDAERLELLSLAEDFLQGFENDRTLLGAWTGTVDANGDCLAVSVPSLAVSAHDCHRKSLFRSLCAVPREGPGDEAYAGPAYAYSCDCRYDLDDGGGKYGYESCSEVTNALTNDYTGFCVVAEDDDTTHVINREGPDK